ncbi:MAG: T9SS type A sorting domain-containing protein [Paludibacteraceae bacterium]|nr:T9SS type A sorting domain-containing protein [Paludibacteraceae bacterium]
MRKLILFTFLLSSLVSIQAKTNKEEVAHIAEKIANDTISEIWLSNQPYTIGDTIFLWSGFVVCPYNEAWCAFIDHHPLRNWGHECTFLFIDTSNGDHFSIKKLSPPKLISENWTKYRTYNVSSRNLSSVPTFFFNSHANNHLTNHFSQIDTVPGFRHEEDSHLYAIIIDFCGPSSEYNHERLWNDCAAMYNTFLNNGYPRDNIFVAMPDNSDGMPLLHLVNGSFIPSPTDLDGDGSSDVRYPATGNGIDELFYDISQVLTESDILTVYLTGHGHHTSDIRNRYYAGVLSDSDYPDGELIRKFSSLNMEILNLIVQREDTYYLQDCVLPRVACNIVMTYDQTNTQDDIAIDDFTNFFTYAVSAGDMSCDLNNDGVISMYEANSYVRLNSFNNDHRFWPHCVSRPTCLDHDLTLNGTIPNEPCIQSDLYMKDNGADYGCEPNVSTNLSYITPDIWIEDLSGNIVNNLISNETYNICVKIRNRGNESSYGDEVLHVHWAKAVIGGHWPDSWVDDNLYNCNGTPVHTGGEITPCEGYNLPIISSHGEYIARIPWITPDNTEYFACSEFENNINELWHYCLLARIYDEHEHAGEDMLPLPLNLFVLNSNNVVSRNITIMNDMGDNTMSSIVGISAPFSGVFTLKYNLSILEDDFYGGNFYLYLNFNHQLYSDWGGEGHGLVNIGDKIQLTSLSAEMENIFLAEEDLHTIMVEAEMDYPMDFVLDVTLYDDNGVAVGGERFQNIGEYAFRTPHIKEKDDISDNYNDVISYDLNAEIKNVRVVNASGQAVIQAKNSAQINTTGLPPGIYFIIVEYTNNSKQYKTIQL